MTVADFISQHWEDVRVGCCILLGIAAWKVCFR